MNKVRNTITLALTLAAGIGEARGVSLGQGDVVRLMAQARGEIRIYAPLLRRLDTAVALKSAMGRGVKVVLITTPETLEPALAGDRTLGVAWAGWGQDPASRLARVYAPQVTNAAESEAFALLDSKVALVGNGLIYDGPAAQTGGVTFEGDQARVRSLARWTNAVEKQGREVDLVAWLRERYKAR